MVVLWIALLYGVYRVSQFERDFIEYDPFAVLEIDKVCVVWCGMVWMIWMIWCAVV